MLAKFRRHLTYANVVSSVCLFVLLGGSAYAATRIGSAQIVNNSVRSGDIRDHTVRSSDINNGTILSRDVKNGHLLAEDFRPGQLPAGATGPQGPAGKDGAAGTGGGGGGISTLTVRTATPPIPVACNDDMRPGTFECTGDGPATARCEPGERATGGGHAGGGQDGVPDPEGADRPDPTAGTPTGWTVDMRIFATRSAPVASVDSVPVYVICAS